MKRVRIGVIGCGAIAQVQHLPFLSELAEEFEVAVVCDVSPSAAEYAAELFHVPRHVTDYRDVLDSDVDAVLLCQTDPKTEVAVASFEAGKHVFMEKPMCFSLGEADAIISAARESGKVGQVGYVKLFEPAFETARREVAAMDDVRFVQVNHLHPDNALHMRQFRTRRFDDVPGDAIERTKVARRAAVDAAIGEAPDHVTRAFGLLSGSLIHDLYGLRVLFGVPSRVVSTEIWAEGRALSTVLEYPEGHRCVTTWVDLPELWDFHETLEVYGGNKRVIVSYESGFSRGVSTVTIQEIDAGGTSVRRQPELDWESPFRRELRHFHHCINTGETPRSPVASARDDIALIIDITKAYVQGGPVAR
jgi:predicted dehydrogenase